MAAVDDLIMTLGKHVEAGLSQFQRLEAEGKIRPGVYGPRELLCKLVWWHQVAAEAMESVGSGGDPYRIYASDDEMDLRAVTRNTGKTVTQLSEAVLSHHQLRVHAPALGEFRRVGEQASERWVPPSRVELQVVAGIRLVDAGVTDRGVVVLPHRVRVSVDRWRDDVDALGVPVERRGLEVGGERDDVAKVLRRLDDVDALVGRNGDEVVLEARMPSLFSFRPTAKPGRFFSTRKAVIPL